MSDRASHGAFTTESATKCGKAGRRTSPWRKGPMCDTGRAKASFIHYCRKGKRMKTTEEKSP